MLIIVLTILVALITLTSCGGGTSTGVTPKSPSPATINHIIYMMQENRSFDHYFGQINSYRQSQGLSTDVDGTPPDAAQIGFDGTTIFTPFHLNSMCVENLSPYWNESHKDRNFGSPTSDTAMMDGFARSAGNNTRNSVPVGFDVNGQRVMGYYDSNDLPYYYFMATQFAMSDRWFAPVMTNTTANRMYAIAATSSGYVNKHVTSKLNVPTIFDELEAANISWRVYVPDFPNGTAMQGFAIYPKFLNTKIVPFADYFDDLKNGTLPQVAMIERESILALDEHPGAGTNIEHGAAYVASIINALMSSTAWQDSVFFLTFDEAGGFYDHVPPAPTVSPDGIQPILDVNDTCAQTTGPACDFVYTGFRLPNIVVSPFSKAHYVDHTNIDTTAILRFIELRFGLKALTARDAAQPDISFFFDYGNQPNLNPPSPPPQPTVGPCYVTSLP